MKCYDRNIIFINKIKLSDAFRYLFAVRLSIISDALLLLLVSELCATPIEGNKGMLLTFVMLLPSHDISAIATLYSFTRVIESLIIPLRIFMG